MSGCELVALGYAVGTLVTVAITACFMIGDKSE